MPEKTALVNNIPVAYAVTYLIGTASLVWFLPTIGPKLMGINLREEAARMQASSRAPPSWGSGWSRPPSSSMSAPTG